MKTSGDCAKTMDRPARHEATLLWTNQGRAKLFVPNRTGLRQEESPKIWQFLCPEFSCHLAPSSLLDGEGFRSRPCRHLLCRTGRHRQRGSCARSEAECGRPSRCWRASPMVGKRLLHWQAGENPPHRPPKRQRGLYRISQYRPRTITTLNPCTGQNY